MKISTGSKDLDDWLSGGYEKGVITTLFGPSSSGKTNLCVLAAARQAAIRKKVIYLDTEGGFSVERLKQVTTQNIMKNILLFQVENFFQQRKAFIELLNSINETIGLVIIDSIAKFYRLELNKASIEKDFKKIRALQQVLINQLETLSEIARKNQIPVLIADQVYDSFKEEKVSMIGKDILEKYSKCIIELKNLGEGRKRAILIKPSNKLNSLNFKIVEEGIKKKF